MNRRKDSHVVDFEFGVLGWHQFEVVYNYTPPGADGSAPSVEILDVVGSPLRDLLGWEDFDNVLVAEVLKHEGEEAARDPGYWDGSPLRMSNRPRGGGDPNAIYMDDPKPDGLNLPKKPKS